MMGRKIGEEMKKIQFVFEEARFWMLFGRQGSRMFA